MTNMEEKTRCRRCGKEIEDRGIITKINHLLNSHDTVWEKIEQTIDDNFDFIDDKGNIF